MRQKRHILGIEGAGSSIFNSRTKVLKEVTFWSILEEFLIPKRQHVFGSSQIYLSAWNEFKDENFGSFIEMSRIFKNIIGKIQIINTPLKYGLTKAFEMIKFIK